MLTRTLITLCTIACALAHKSTRPSQWNFNSPLEQRLQAFTDLTHTHSRSHIDAQRAFREARDALDRDSHVRSGRKIDFSSPNGPDAHVVPASDAHCFQDTCGIHIYDESTLRVGSCTMDHIGFTFTSCDTESNTRTLVPFYKPPATCVGGVNLRNAANQIAASLNTPRPTPGPTPAPVDPETTEELTNLNQNPDGNNNLADDRRAPWDNFPKVPCDANCASGEFFSLGDNQCMPCAAGTMSQGNGILFEEWNSWPAQFFTFCTDSTGQRTCGDGWQLNGDYIDSGDHRDQGSIYVTLALVVEFYHPGSIEIEYTVSAEVYDKFRLIVDDLTWLTAVYRSDYDDYRTFNTRDVGTIDPGVHVIKFQYRKDPTQSQRADRVFIRTIALNGTSHVNVQCEECPKGFYAPEGSSACLECPADTFALAGAGECTPCPSGTYSYAGADKCIIQRPCTQTDYTSYVESCPSNGATVQTTPILMQPPACDPNLAGSHIPTPESVTCTVPPCDEGEVKTDGECRTCPSGNFANAGQCAVCQPGTAASSKYYKLDDWDYSTIVYDEDDNPNGVWYSGCFGEQCYSTEGWRFGREYADSGLGHGKGIYSFLYSPYFEFGPHGGRVCVTHSMMCASDQSLGIFLLGGRNYTQTCSVEYATNSTGDAAKTCSEIKPETSCFDALPHDVGLGFLYHKMHDDPILNPECDRLIIHDIVVEGTQYGGATSCEDCPVGYHSFTMASDDCAACPAGYSTETSGQTICTECEVSSFAGVDGSECLPCGLNAHHKLLTESRESCFPCENLAIGEHVYQVGKMSQMYNDVVEYTDASGANMTTRVSFGVCRPPANNTNYESGCTHDSYACLEYVDGMHGTTNAHGLGRIPNFDIIMKDDLAPEGGLQMYFTSPAPGAPHNSNNSLTVNIICDPTFHATAESVPQGAEIDDETNAVTLTWRTPFGCSVCTKKDIETYEGRCRNGLKQLTYSYKRVCFGGMPLPITKMMSCESLLNLSPVAVFGVVVLVLLGLFLLLFLVFYLYSRYSSIKEKYNDLMSKSGAEFDQLPPTVDHDPRDDDDMADIGLDDEPSA